MDFALTQHTLPRTHFAQSSTEGLNLNITLPRMTKSSEPLPVLVFLHGGGFEIGSSSWPQNRLNRLVSLACEIGLPVLGVSIKYVNSKS
jgi:carboxylesterase type B